MRRQFKIGSEALGKAAKRLRDSAARRRRGRREAAQGAASRGGLDGARLQGRGASEEETPPPAGPDGPRLGMIGAGAYAGYRVVRERQNGPEPVDAGRLRPRARRDARRLVPGVRPAAGPGRLTARPGRPRRMSAARAWTGPSTTRASAGGRRRPRRCAEAVALAGRRAGRGGAAVQAAVPMSGARHRRASEGRVSACRLLEMTYPATPDANRGRSEHP